MRSFLNKILYGGGVFFDLCKWVILAAVIVILILKLWISFFIVDGLSMEPTLHDKELILLQKNSYTKNDPKRGDVVVVEYPGDPENKKYVKRVVGLPSEKMTIRTGKVYINDQLLEEDYIPFGVTTEPNKQVILSNTEYYLMGDNRTVSNDSRVFGPVEKRFVWGKAIWIILPRFRSI